MLSIKINNLRKFTSMLFVEESFDKFLLHDAEIVTQITTNISGQKNLSFYDEEEREKEKQVSLVSYKELRPFIFSLIKGKRLPISFKIVLLTSPDVTESTRKKADFTACEVSSLSMNISFKEGILSLTTGVSYNGFSLDKTLEHFWDQNVKTFLNSKEIEYEEL